MVLDMFRSLFKHVFKVFSLGRVVLYTVFVVFSLRKTLVKTLAKNLVKNLAKNLGPGVGGGIFSSAYGSYL